MFGEPRGERAASASLTLPSSRIGVIMAVTTGPNRPCFIHAPLSACYVAADL